MTPERARQRRIEIHQPHGDDRDAQLLTFYEEILRTIAADEGSILALAALGLWHPQVDNSPPKSEHAGPLGMAFGFNGQAPTYPPTTYSLGVHEPNVNRWHS